FPPVSRGRAEQRALPRRDPHRRRPRRASRRHGSLPNHGRQTPHGHLPRQKRRTSLHPSQIRPRPPPPQSHGPQTPPISPRRSPPLRPALSPHPPPKITARRRR